MPLNDPVAVFTASSNVRAQTLCHLLEQAGVEAHVIEDLSLAGLWIGGTIPGLHNPKIWVNRADAERATAILQQHAQREAELQAPVDGNTEPVDIECEECGELCSFSPAQLGSVPELAQISVNARSVVWNVADEAKKGELHILVGATTARNRRLPHVDHDTVARLHRR